MTALSLYVYGRKTTALGLATFALCLHALMALPMVLLLVGLNGGVRASIIGALAIVASVLVVAVAAVLAPHWSPKLLAMMDTSWLEMVRERSQFVFLQLWRWDDWVLNIRPLLSLVLTMLVLCDARMRGLCSSSLIVGAAGLAVALIASIIGPVAVLLQGQAWRWMWVPVLVSSLLVVPTVFHMWRTDKHGPLCAVLLLAGWLLSSIDGVYFVVASLCLWAARGSVPKSADPYLRFGGLAAAVSVIVWILAHGWPALTSYLAVSGTEAKALHLAHSIMGLDCLPFLFAFVVSDAILRSRWIVVPGVTALALGTVTALAAPGALEDHRTEGSGAQIAEFADWRRVIPPGANVFVANRYYSAGFAWFTLQRPSYLTVDQSSGVIFSSATAAEIRRRSEVLRPMEEPDWRLLTRRAIHGTKFDARALPLTKGRLVRICADPVLDFVIAKEDVGLGAPLRHSHPGPWNGWNLYDCRRVNSPERRE